jgi:nicotinate dehydrogenase subunit B
VTSRDWQSYPILRFSEVPGVTTSLIDRPLESPLGAGEATQGPTAAAAANAVAAATGIRVRDLPLTPANLQANAGR